MKAFAAFQHHKSSEDGYCAIKTEVLKERHLNKYNFSSCASAVNLKFGAADESVFVTGVTVAAVIDTRLKLLFSRSYLVFSLKCEVFFFLLFFNLLQTRRLPLLFLSSSCDSFSKSDKTCLSFKFSLKYEAWNSHKSNDAVDSVSVCFPLRSKALIFLILFDPDILSK